MKKVSLALVLTLTLALFMMPLSHALGLGGLGSLFGGNDEQEEEIDLVFTGELVDVEIDGKTIQVHQDFKDLIDEYEATFDEFVAILSDENTDPMTLLSMMSEFSKITEKLSALDSIDLDEGDALYYQALMVRINEKMEALDAMED